LKVSDCLEYANRQSHTRARAESNLVDRRKDPVGCDFTYEDVLPLVFQKVVCVWDRTLPQTKPTDELV
jgi:hypothetical protein